MCPVYRHSESDLEIMEKGFAAMTCSELLNNCPAFPNSRHPFEKDDTEYWGNKKYINCCPCLRQCGNSSTAVSWATRYWKKLSMAYLELYEAVQNRQSNNQALIAEEFVTAINNILRGISKHFEAQQAEKTEIGTTGCVHVDAIFFPEQKPAYFLYHPCIWDNNLYYFSQAWQRKVLLLATYLKLISHNATKYTNSLIWIPPKFKGKFSINNKIGIRLATAKVNVAITEFPHNKHSLIMFLKKRILSPKDIENVRDGKRILQLRRCNIHFPEWADFRPETYDFILHLCTPTDLKATAKFKKAYMAATSVLALPCCNSQEQLKRMVKKMPSMPFLPQMAINAPVILSKKTKQAQFDIMKILLDILENSAKPKKTAPLPPSQPADPFFEKPLDSIITMVLNLYDWKERGFAIRISDYMEETRRYFSLAVPFFYETPRIPAFFTKQKSPKSKHCMWYTPPQKSNRHEMNALRLLVFHLAKIDCYTQSRKVDENILRQEMTSVCQQVRNLGFRPSAHRKTFSKQPSSRTRQRKYHCLKEWVEDYISRHATNHWNSELTKVLKGECENAHVVCNGFKGNKIEVIKCHSVISIRVITE